MAGPTTLGESAGCIGFSDKSLTSQLEEKGGDGSCPVLSRPKGLALAWVQPYDSLGFWWKSSSRLTRKEPAFARPVALRTASSNSSLQRCSLHSAWCGESLPTPCSAQASPFFPSSIQDEQEVALKLAYI